MEAGSEVGLFYDPMLAKLIVWAPARDQAIVRMRRALTDLVITGIETSRDFHVRVMDDAEFRAGEIEIQWLERRLASILDKQPDEENLRAAAVAAALLADRDRGPRRASASGRPEQAEKAPSANSWLRAALSDGLRS